MGGKEVAGGVRPMIRPSISQILMEKRNMNAKADSNVELVLRFSGDHKAWNFVRDLWIFFMAVGKEFKVWLGLLGLTILRFWTPLLGKPMPNSVFWTGVGFCLFLAVFFGWRKEHKKIAFVSAFVDSMNSRCEYVIVEWQKLGDLYQNSTKREGQPTTLQGPMEPWWVSSEYRMWPYKIGVLQAYTTSLRQDLHRIGVAETSEWNVRIPLSELVETLREYRAKIERLTA